MADEIEMVSVSQVAKTIQVKYYPALSEEDLDNIVKESKYGLAMHALLEIPDDDPLPIHIHPKTLLSMVQEIQTHREGF